MHWRRFTAWATVTILLLATATAIAAPARQASATAGSIDELDLDPADPPAEAQRYTATIAPGQAVAVRVHVPTGTIDTAATPIPVVDRPAPEPGDAACLNTFPRSFRWMGPTTASVALPGAAFSAGGTSCSATPLEITRTMEHVRVVSAGSYHGGIQAYHWADDGSIQGLFTVWCGGTFGMTDRPPEDGDAFYEGPGDLGDTQPGLVNCYAITRGEAHPSTWERWSAATINWHGDGGFVDARVTLSS